MTGPDTPTRAVIVDVDGVVSPVRGSRTVWGDEVVAGTVVGRPVLMSPDMCARLDRLAQIEGVGCGWLTSWSAEMRAGVDPFPGHDWPAISERDDLPRVGRGWWKLAAVESWLVRHPEVRSVAWCDDHLRGGRPAAARRRLAARGVEGLLVVPSPELGLTPLQVDHLERWAAEQ